MGKETSYCYYRWSIYINFGKVNHLLIISNEDLLARRTLARQCFTEIHVIAESYKKVLVYRKEFEHSHFYMEENLKEWTLCSY